MRTTVVHWAAPGGGSCGHVTGCAAMEGERSSLVMRIEKHLPSRRMVEESLHGDDAAAAFASMGLTGQA